MRKQRFTYTRLTSLMLKWDYYYFHNHYITSCFHYWRKVLGKELYGLLHPQNDNIVHTLTIGIHEQFTMGRPSSPLLTPRQCLCFRSTSAKPSQCMWEIFENFRSAQEVNRPHNRADSGEYASNYRLFPLRICHIDSWLLKREIKRDSHPNSKLSGMKIFHGLLVLFGEFSE